MAGGGRAHAALRRTAPLRRALTATAVPPAAIGVALLLLCWLSWPIGPLAPGAGLDNSWAIGLGMALGRGLSFGRDVAFTYGPLGIFEVPRATSSGTLLAGVLGALGMHVLLAAMLLAAMRRRIPFVAAVVVTLAALLIVAASALLPTVAVGFGAVALTLGAPPERAGAAARRLAFGGGALAGIVLLVKFNDGVAVGALVLIALAGLPGARRNLPIAIASIVATTVLAWLAAGQPLTALPDFISTSVGIVRGYVDAMGYDVLGAGGGWIVIVVIASACALVVGAARSSTGEPLRRRSALLLAIIVAHYFVAREMFVRYDAQHAIAIALLLPLPLLVPWRNGLGLFGWATGAMLATATLAALGLDSLPAGTVFDPLTRAGNMPGTVSTVLSPGATINLARATIQAAEGVPATIVQQLDGHCVDAEPWEISAIWAYPAWRWCPIGAMQSYAAFTGSLDQLDAQRYASARRGPDRVLRQAVAIDGRNPTWESPAAMLSLFCHFREVTQGGAWQLLARIPDRCGAERPLETIHGRGPLPIPPAPAGKILVAQVYGLQVGGPERLRTLFGRAAPRTLVVNGTATWRVLPDTVSDGLVLDVPASADYAPPFNFDIAASSLEAEIGGKPVPFTVRLLTVPVRSG